MDIITPSQTNQEFIYYRGSLTTPPCTEAVNWLLFRDYQMMSKAQWDAYQLMFSGTITSYSSGTGTYRSTQAVNSRTIYLYYGYITAGSYLQVLK